MLGSFSLFAFVYKKNSASFCFPFLHSAFLVYQFTFFPSGVEILSKSNFTDVERSKRWWTEGAINHFVHKWYANHTTKQIKGPMREMPSWNLTVAQLVNKFLSTSYFFAGYFITRPPLRSSGQSSWLLKGDVLCFLWGTNWIYVM
jgi:hypothetical protein